MAMDFGKPLKRKDLQEKVDKNLEKGRSLRQQKYSLMEERNDFQRSILRQQVQIQNLNEQIAYVDYLIAGDDKKD